MIKLDFYLPYKIDPGKPCVWLWRSKYRRSVLIPLTSQKANMSVWRPFN